MNMKSIGLPLGPALFLLIISFVSPEGLSTEGVALLATTVWIAVWWITEAIPIAATALLPLLLFPFLGVLSLKETTEPYSDPMVLLYMGGFMIAVTIEKWNLHKRIALKIISLIGTEMRRVVLGFMVATGFISMWISNTATALMMLPIAMAVIAQLSEQVSSKEYAEQTVGRALMLGIAYSASIGGIATLIGTPTNIVFAGIVKQIYGIEIAFNDWMMLGLPVAVVLLGASWYYLVYIAFDFSQTDQITVGKEGVQRQLQELGKMTKEEKRVLAVFLAVSFAWVTRSFLLQPFIPVLDDTLIALFGVLALFVLPANGNERLLDWKAAEQIPWGILILFGGGLALAAAFQNTGLAKWLGEQFIGIQQVPYWVFLLLILASVNFLTEITSNVATASMLLPILAAVALALGVHPYGLMIGATLSASCAFMLPVATPPNAVVFGSGYLTIPAMMRAGFAMNIISIIIIYAVIKILLPWFWGIDLNHFPDHLR